MMKTIQISKKNSLFKDLFVEKDAMNFVLYENFCSENEFFDFECP